MNKLFINITELEKNVKEAVEEMINFDWSGWKIDILIDSDGNITTSEKNTNNIYQNMDVLFSVYSLTFEHEDIQSESDFIDECTNDFMNDFESKEIDNFDELQYKYDVEFIF